MWLCRFTESGDCFTAPVAKGTAAQNEFGLCVPGNSDFVLHHLNAPRRGECLETVMPQLTQSQDELNLCMSGTTPQVLP